MDTGVDSSSFEILDGGADAHEPPFLEQPAKKSMSVARPRVNANPRTGPMAKMYSTSAAANDTVLADTRVWNERAQPRSTEVRRVRPSRTSSLSRSKNTT